MDKGDFKYLQVQLGQEAVQQKKWEGTVEKIERFNKWKWIHAQMSFRGRMLVIH